MQIQLQTEIFIPGPGAATSGASTGNLLLESSMDLQLTEDGDELVQET